MGNCDVQFRRLRRRRRQNTVLHELTILSINIYEQPERQPERSLNSLSEKFYLLKYKDLV